MKFAAEQLEKIYFGKNSFKPHKIDPMQGLESVSESERGFSQSSDEADDDLESELKVSNKSDPSM